MQSINTRKTLFYNRLTHQSVCLRGAFPYLLPPSRKTRYRWLPTPAQSRCSPRSRGGARPSAAFSPSSGRNCPQRPCPCPAKLRPARLVLVPDSPSPRSSAIERSSSPTDPCAPLLLPVHAEPPLLPRRLPCHSRSRHGWFAMDAMSAPPHTRPAAGRMEADDHKLIWSRWF